MIAKDLMDGSHYVEYGNRILLPMILTLLLGACAQNPAASFAKGEPPLVGPREAQAPTEAASLEPVVMRTDHPRSYTVRSGDTLWGIAERFLRDPWRWPDVWHQNPQISNPDLIFPGDVIELVYEGDRPRLQISSRGSGDQIIKLSPTARVQPLVQPIPTLPRSAIEQFLGRSLVLTEDQWQDAPHIVGAVDDSLIFGPYTQVYARGDDFDQPIYQVFRPGEQYYDPVTREPLGFAVTYVGEAHLEQDSDPATLRLTNTSRESRAGDRLFAVEDDDEIYRFQPRPGQVDTDGRIVAILDGGFLSGQYQTVVLNLGEWDGMEPGDVLAVYNQGRVTRDPLYRDQVQLPDARAGLIMVYKVFERTSYGLIVNATRSIGPNDRVMEP